jgi:hypothetical protein
MKSSGTIFKIHIDTYSTNLWMQKCDSHKYRISNLLGDYLYNRERQVRHPVIDFLFEYYSFRPSLLSRWSPGIQVILKGKEARHFLNYREYTETESGVTLDLKEFPVHRLSSFEWILELLEATYKHSPTLGCFGMHEWAMVYRTDQLRHPYLSMRLPQEQITEFIESRPVVCSHYDAFRFFTKKARPLNKLQPNRKNLKKLEQPGCIHANMDLYKWAYKLYPWISSDLIADAFELALDARITDMKASPYDLTNYGYEPIKIETEKGRLTYIDEQKKIFKRSMSLREELINVYRQLISLFK